jgi:hypothetical protein
MESPTSRLWLRTAYLVCLLGFSWSVMIVTHESGHILGGWLSGATLQAYDLRPWRLPYSLHNPDPHPLITLWSGPLFGVLAPIATALLFRRSEIWVIAYFCCIANGVYLAASWITSAPFLDTPMLLKNGASAFSIILYCLLTIPIGYAGLRHHAIVLLQRPRSLTNKQPTQ